VHQGKNPDHITLNLIDETVVLVRDQLASTGDGSQPALVRKVSQTGGSSTE